MMEKRRVLSFALALVLLAVLALVPAAGSAEGEMTDRDAYVNQWARSDLRAWLNGLMKTAAYRLPLDGSSGVKQTYNFLRFFTDAELNLFQPRDVTTVMFNDGEFNGTTSEVVTKDRFWLPSGFVAYGTSIQFTCEDIIISADPGCDLSDYYTVRQKVKYGKANNWKYLIPVPYWGGEPQFYGSGWLRSAYYDSANQALMTVAGYDTIEEDVDQEYLAYSFACGAVSLPSNLFAAAATATSESGYLNRKVIAAYERLGVKDNRGDAVPSWGMYIKQISLDSLSGSLVYDNTSGSLTFTSSAALPENAALMVQAYTEWDSNRTATENARRGDTLYAAGKRIHNGSTTSVVFSSTQFTEPLNGFTVKVWVEIPATENALTQASAPLTFRIDSTGSATEVTETKSGNPRVFAYRSDLACSWGTLDLSSQVSGEDNSFNERFLYAGNDATWQKLYIGTGENRKPIEWWIAGRDGDSLMLYQASYAETSYNYIEFNRNTYYDYNDTVKNPSLKLGNIGYDDLSNPFAKLTLRPNKDSQDELDAPASSYSLQFCAENGFEWEDSLPAAGGKTYVRAKYAGGTIDGTKYAPCYSNVKEITVPVKYPVTVTNGTGGGSYAEGEAVSIQASDPPQGQRFKEWTWTGPESLTFTSGSRTTASATFTMPGQAVDLTANNEDIPASALTAAAPAFDAEVYGYAQPAAKGIRLSCEGNSSAVISSAALSGTNADSFTLNRTGGATVAAGTADDTTYTVRPAAGLNAGSYTATVTFTYNEGTATSCDVSFTVGKAPQTAPAAPVAESVTETCVTLNRTDGYQYSLDGTTWQDSNVFSGLTPNREYTFYQRIAGDANHEPSPASPGTAVTTGGIVYTLIDSTGKEHTVGSGENAVYTVKRNVHDEETYPRYTGATVDGKAIPEGGSTVKEGSLILTLKSSYLDTLSEGNHEVKISFTDGSVKASLKIVAVTPTPTPTPKPRPVPKTGDTGNPALWIILGLAGFTGLAILGGWKASRKKK